MAKNEQIIEHLYLLSLYYLKYGHLPSFKDYEIDVEKNQFYKTCLGRYSNRVDFTCEEGQQLLNEYINNNQMRNLVV